MSNKHAFPLLYSFRRCPYAMRARLALKISGIQVELREIVLRNKPKEMLLASSKATVPVLVTLNNEIFDESIDIMFWAFEQNDPMNLLDSRNLEDAKAMIKLNDEKFKTKLDKYKYAIRFPEKSETEHRTDGLFFLEELNKRLSNTSYLTGENPSIADFAIFPFVRQFASVDRVWFENSEFSFLRNWLDLHLNSDLFQSTMQKYEPWDKSKPSVIF